MNPDGTSPKLSVTALVNTSGAVVERYSYDPYGRVTVRHGVIDAAGQDTSADEWTDRTSDTFENSILYAGYVWDPKVGLFHVRNRTYHPTLGRWLQRDPLGYVDGMSLYEYVRSVPTRYVDWTGAEAEAYRPPRDARKWTLFDLAYVHLTQTMPMMDPETGLIMGPIETMPDEVMENIAKENKAVQDVAVLKHVAKRPTGTWEDVLKKLGEGKTAGGRRYYDVFVDAYQIAHKYIWMYSTTVEHKYKVPCCWFSDRPCDSDDETVEVRVWGELLVGLYQFRKKGASVVSSFEVLDKDTDRDGCATLSGRTEGFSTGRLSSRGHEVSLKADKCQCGSHTHCHTWRSPNDELKKNKNKLAMIRKAERYAKSKYQGVNSKHHMFQVLLGQYIVDKKGEIDIGPGPLHIFIGEAAGKGPELESGRKCW